MTTSSFTTKIGGGSTTRPDRTPSDGLAVGKRTLVEALASAPATPTAVGKTSAAHQHGGVPGLQLKDMAGGPRPGAPVQRKAAGGVAQALVQDAAWVGGAAELATSGAAGRLPHGDRIQQAFGGHDVSGVQAFIGGAAAEGTAQMGARAFATGDRVAFATAPDLHTAAHEAAHVVQQRRGATVPGGVGREGDDHERNADAVADAVVRGESAERLLGRPAASAAPGASRGAAIQRVLDANLVTAIGELFEKNAVDGHVEKKQMAVIDRLRLMQIDASPEIANAVKFLFSELDPGKSELLRQALFARGGQAAQLAIDRTIDQIGYYTQIGDNHSVTWFTNTTPMVYRPRLAANHGQPALAPAQAQPAPPGGQAVTQANLELAFAANRVQPVANGDTWDVAVAGVGTNNQVTLRIGHFQRRHTFEHFHFGPDNIFKGNFDLNGPHGLFPAGTNVLALATQLVQNPAIISALQAAMADPNATWWSGSEAGTWFAFEFANRAAVTLVQFYSLGGVLTTLGDLKTTGINRRYDDYAHHQTPVNPQAYAALPGQAPTQPTSRERFGQNRVIDHWNDPSGNARHTDWRWRQGQWGQEGGWRLDQPAPQNGQQQALPPQLMAASWDPQNGVQWNARRDDATLFGQLNQTTNQIDYRGERQNQQGGREFLFPHPNPQPADWKGIAVTQPNGGAQVEVTNPQNQAVESGRRIQTDGTTHKWDPNGQAYVPDLGTEATGQQNMLAAWIQWAETDAIANPNAQQPSQLNAPPVAVTAFADYQAGVQAAIQAPAQVPQGTPSHLRGYQAALGRYRQAETDVRQAYNGGQANPQPNNPDAAYLAGWNAYVAGWTGAAQGPNGQPPGNAHDTGFTEYIQLYDAGVNAAEVAGAQGNANSQNPAHLTGWADFVTGWTDAQQNPLAQAPQVNTRGGLRGFQRYRLLHPAAQPPPPQQQNPQPPPNMGGGGLGQGGGGLTGSKRKADQLTG